MLRLIEVACLIFLPGNLSQLKHDGPVMLEVMQEAGPLTVTVGILTSDVTAATIAATANGSNV